MGTIINASIDATKIKRSMLKKEKYLDVTILVNDKFDDYGNNAAFIVSQTKAQQEAKEPKIYLGNGKVVFSDTPVMVAPKRNEKPINSNDESDDLPF